MSLTELYQQRIKQLSLSDSGQGKIYNANYSLPGYNPSCGDELELYLNLDANSAGPTISKIRFEADACVICKASLSLLCEHSENKSVDGLLKDIKHLNIALKNNQDLKIESLDCLNVVSQYPSRINCALLPWQTLQKILTTLLPAVQKSSEVVNA